MNVRTEALKLVVNNGYKDIVELGVWEGKLSKLLYKVADNLTLVDPWRVENNYFGMDYLEGLGSVYKCTMGEEELRTQEQLDDMYVQVLLTFPKATVIRLDSIKAAKCVPNKSVDFVFLDSIHTYEYCKKEILTWLPKIKPGGMIAGDDYRPEHLTVAKAVDELLGKQEFDIWSHKI